MIISCNWQTRLFGRNNILGWLPCRRLADLLDGGGETFLRTGRSDQRQYQYDKKDSFYVVKRNVLNTIPTR